MTNEEYNACFFDFWDLREEIAQSLVLYGLHPGTHVLDVAAGHGLFAFEIAKIIQRGEVHAVGLENDLNAFQRFQRSLPREERQKVRKVLQYHVMDATNLAFPSARFDFVVNFLGLEDINMTKGEQGVKDCITEVVRVLKSQGILLLTVCLYGDQPDEKLAKELSRQIGHNAIFYPKEFYIEQLTSKGVKIMEEKWFYTRRKMTSSQAKEELQFACAKTPKIFDKYNVETVTFETLWNKYQDAIDAHGVAYYSDLCVIIGKK